jgi:hypothetical protein
MLRADEDRQMNRVYMLRSSIPATEVAAMGRQARLRGLKLSRRTPASPKGAAAFSRLAWTNTCFNSQSSSARLLRTVRRVSAVGASVAKVIALNSKSS